MAKKKGYTGELKLGRTNNLKQLDERFQNISPFTGLKLYRDYNEVVQQSNNKQKVMIKQLIAAADLLLIQDVSELIYCICVIINFTILAQYSLHNDETFFYIENALYRLDKIKMVFKNHCLIDVKLV